MGWSSVPARACKDSWPMSISPLPNTLQPHFFAAAVADPIVIEPEGLSSDDVLEVKDLVMVSIVLRRRALSLMSEVVELPRELLMLEKELLSIRVAEGLWMPLSFRKLALSIHSAIDDSRLWTTPSGSVTPPVGGELLGVRLGDVGGERF